MSAPPPPRSPTRFVTPTQGLGARRGQPTTSLQNVGGRHLVFEEMKNHKNRMKAVRAVIDLAPPWSHAAPPGRPASAAARKLRNNVAAARDGDSRPPSAQARPLSRPQSAARQYSPAVPTPEAAAARFDVAALDDEEDREAYAAMLRLLTKLSNGQSRAALEQLYRESEDRRLLAAYTGVFPKLDAERAAQ
jgi:hypothetical protein